MWKRNNFVMTPNSVMKLQVFCHIQCNFFGHTLFWPHPSILLLSILLLRYKWRWRQTQLQTRNTISLGLDWNHQYIIEKSRSDFGDILTCIHERLCCLGDKKKVPSIKGYRSYTVRTALHRTQGTLFILLLAKLDRMKIRVSSFPILHSSSILIWYELIFCFGRTLNEL